MKSFREIDAFRTISYVIITALLGGCLALSGCDIDTLVSKDGPKNKKAGVIERKGDSTGESAASPGAITVIDVNGDEHETEVSVIEAGENEDNSSTSLPERSLAQVAQNISMSDDENFAYSELSESGKTCYAEIYSILTDMLEKVELSSRDTDEIDQAFRAVMVDHPEIFYVKGYSIGKYMNGKMLKKIVFSGTYTMDKTVVENKQSEVEAYVDDVVSGCPKGAGDYDKIKYVYDYLIRHNEYVPDSENNQNILSVVENGKTVCQGYTKAMQLILGRMGIFCTLVNGTACGANGVPDSAQLANAKDAEWGGHVWNIVKCNGLYYNIDVTWGDAVITLMKDDGTLSQNVDVNYEFFLVDDATLDETHAPEPVVQMPYCNSMEDNYYRHEGLYFTDINSDQFYRAFESALSSGQTVMYLKASSDDVYRKIKDHLFVEENIFKYIGRTNVRYVEFADRDMIMISL
ncbi:MAG: hypothetical protein IKO16_01305 [Lachnospiraceae bacterium]|nr:hypothetical protein [Lachnospiraceae bacterium]